MAKNYIIKTVDDVNNVVYFSGWDAILGGAKYNANKGLAYRMLRTLAEKELPKLEMLWQRKCKIEQI